jgi:branched-chain amino acid transport system substrate-binding protein
MTNFQATRVLAMVLAASAFGAAVGQTPAGAAASGKPHVAQVAAVLELSGRFAQYGQLAKAGIEAAVAEASKAGKNHISVKYYDCGAGKEACVNLTRQAITADGAQAVIGPIVSLNLIPTTEVTKSLNVPQLMVTVNKGLTDGKPNVFRFGDTETANNLAQAKYISTHIKPGQKVAILAAANDYGQEASRNLTTILKDKYKIEVAATETIQLAQPDYTPALLTVRKVDPAFIALFTQPAADAAAVLKGARQNGIKAQFIMDANPDLATVAGAAADGIIQAGPWFPSGTNEKQKAFIALAKASAEITLPSWISAMTHDAAQSLIEIVPKHGATSAALLAGLTNMKGFSGIANAPGDFDAERAYIREAAIAQLRNGQYVDIK